VTRRATTERLSTWTSGHPYLVTSSMIAAVTGIGFAAGNLIKTSNLDVLYLLVVFVSALTWGRRPAVFAALASTLLFEYCFIPPYYTFAFAVRELPYVITLFAFVIVAVITSELAARAHDAIRAREDRARAEAVARAKDEILDRISHELKTPLNAVLGWTHLLRQSADDPKRIAKGLFQIEHSTELLARLAGDLLDMSRVHSGKLKVDLRPTTLGPIVSRCVDRVVTATGKEQVVVECAIDSDADILADEQRIEQIVTNLLSNAIKFTPPKGRVRVHLASDGIAARLRVIDSGIGIPAEFLPHVFEPFRQADGKHAHEGLGLGLAIVKSLVEAHGGAIEVESAGRGRGATFTVEIPVRRPPAVSVPDFQAVAGSSAIH
jgi:K+-sensing histidine kinase KdpD